MVKYFAYGSNLYLKQMQDVLRRKNFYVEIVMLRDYELIFADNGIASYATIKKRNGAKVIGLLYNVSADEVRLLDDLEKKGFGGYERIQVRLNTGANVVEAETYIMIDFSAGKRMDFRYLATMLHGMIANDFDKNYILEVIQKAEGVVV